MFRSLDAFVFFFKINTKKISTTTNPALSAGKIIMVTARYVHPTEMGPSHDEILTSFNRPTTTAKTSQRHDGVDIGWVRTTASTSNVGSAASTSKLELQLTEEDCLMCCHIR